MSHQQKPKPPTTPEPTSEPGVEDYAALAEQEREFDDERKRLGAAKPLTIREAAGILAGLRHLARLANGGN